MTDEYLWDRSGEVDPEVRALERLLSSYAAPALETPRAETPLAETPWRWALVAVAVAALALLAIGVASLGRRPLPPAAAGVAWQLAPITGRPQLASNPVAGPRQVVEGAWIDTDAGASASLALGGAGRVIIAPQTRLRVTRATAADQHLHLEHGTIDAVVWAPPGQVVVTTPLATAVDLGCAYTLTLDARGQGSLRVTTGWVGLIHDGREAFVPAGASVGIHPGSGPGTPVLVAATDRLRGAVDAFDAAPDAAGRRRALDAIILDASPGDALTLWHLLTRADPADRSRLFDALAARLSPPDQVSRAGIVAGDRAMLDAWWTTLGYGDRAWWQLWLREWRGPS